MISRTLLVYASAIIAVISVGAIGSYILGRSNFNVPINTPEDALYFTISTLSTVGYGDIYPVTPLGRAFVMVLIVIGLGIFLGAVSALAGEFLNSRVNKDYNVIPMLERGGMRNHIVLIGYDATNAMLLDMLKGRNVIVISRSKEFTEEIRKRGFRAYNADPSLTADLKQFNLQKAKEIVIDLTNKERIVYVAMVVKKIAPGVPTSVVATTPDVEAHLRDIGIENIINPTKMAAEALRERMGK